MKPTSPSVRACAGKNKPGVQICNGFADHISYTFAVPPPVSGIIIRIGNGNDADCCALAQRPFKKKPCPTRMNVLRQNVDGMHARVMVGKPSIERPCSAVGAIALTDARRNWLDQIG